MSSKSATIEVYSDYNKEGIVNYDLPFSYGCSELDLMGYMDIDKLIKDVRIKLKNGK